MVQEFQSHNIYTCANDSYLLSNPIKSEDPSYISKLNALDKLIVGIQLQAEIKCCKRGTKYDWSDDIHFNKMILQYWYLQRKSGLIHLDVTVVLQSIYNQLPESYQSFIDITTNSPYRNWLGTKKKLRALMAQHKRMVVSIKNDETENEAKFTGHTIDQAKLRKERAVK